MITFNTYMPQFTSLHHGIIIRKKITTYFDAKVTFKNTCFLCEKLIKSNTPDFTHRRIYERAKLFPIKHKIGDFHKYFYIKKLKNYPTTAVTTKYLENIILLMLDINNLNLHQSTSVLGQIQIVYV